VAIYTSGVSSIIFDKKTKTISASTTDFIDEVEVAIFKGIKYFVFISNSTKTVMFELKIIKDGLDIYEVVSGKLGSGINYKLTTTTSVGIMKVNIQNNETSSLQTEILKYKYN
jgi:hypothetical protein